MLIEVRKLVFSDELLQQALLNLCEKEGLEVPNSQIQKVRFTPAKPGGKASVVIEFVTANPDKPFEVNLSEDFVLSAMILSCKEFGVPLPRDASKSIQLTDQGLAMIVSMKIKPKVPLQKAAS